MWSDTRARGCRLRRFHLVYHRSRHPGSSKCCLGPPDETTVLLRAESPAGLLWRLRGPTRTSMARAQIKTHLLVCFAVNPLPRNGKNIRAIGNRVHEKGKPAARQGRKANRPRSKAQDVGLSYARRPPPWWLGCRMGQNAPAPSIEDRGTIDNPCLSLRKGKPGESQGRKATGLRRQGAGSRDLLLLLPAAGTADCCLLPASRVAELPKSLSDGG